MRWKYAMERALYGPSGFYRHPDGPAAHFRTSVHATPLFATALLRLLTRVDKALGHPPTIDVVDVGAGRGELLAQLSQQAPAELGQRCVFTAVEVAARPTTLASHIQWRAHIPEFRGLLIANEWLDNVPLDIAIIDAPGSARYVLVDEAGTEHPGPAIGPEDAAWLSRWAPTDAARVELGTTRAKAWQDTISQLRAGVAVAIDYRASGAATLTGFSQGREVAPIPDGSCDITAHVHVESVAAAGIEAGALTSVELSQRAALMDLGITAARPRLDLAAREPLIYMRALAEAGQAAEILDPDGLGAFAWLIQTKELPAKTAASILPTPIPPNTAREQQSTRGRMPG
ncbi:MAG: hypothetical protein HOQ05_06560 [Corynebacteriales bacterium]|nr:hypothetical protein [Mycobacteriales bacterium]